MKLIIGDRIEILVDGPFMSCLKKGQVTIVRKIEQDGSVSTRPKHGRYTWWMPANSKAFAKYARLLPRKKAAR